MAEEAGSAALLHEFEPDIIGFLAQAIDSAAMSGTTVYSIVTVWWSLATTMPSLTTYAST